MVLLQGVAGRRVSGAEVMTTASRAGRGRSPEPPVPDEDGVAPATPPVRRGTGAPAPVRRRRIVAAVAGGVLAGLPGCWPARSGTSSRPTPGSPGPPVVVTVDDGESTGAVIDALASRGVIGSTLAFRMCDLVHGDPAVLPGAYLLHQNQSFSTSGRSCPAVPTSPPSRAAGPTLCRGGRAGRRRCRPHPRAFEQVARSGAVRSPCAPPGSNDLEGCSAPGPTRCCPGEIDDDLLAHMVERFDCRGDAAGAGLSRRPPPRSGSPLPGDHRGLGGGEGGLHPRVNMGRWPGSSTTGWPRTCRCRWTRRCCTPRPGRGTGDRRGPQRSHALQHLPPQRADPHADLLPLGDRPGRRRPPAAGGWLYFVVVQKDGTRPSPTPTPSSWPTSSWRRPVGSPEPRRRRRRTMDAGPAPWLGPDTPSSG